MTGTRQPFLYSAHLSLVHRKWQSIRLVSPLDRAIYMPPLYNQNRQPSRGIFCGATMASDLNGTIFICRTWGLVTLIMLIYRVVMFAVVLLDPCYK